jgi:hypothetical protein
MLRNRFRYCVSSAFHACWSPDAACWIRLIVLLSSEIPVIGVVDAMDAIILHQYKCKPLGVVDPRMGRFQQIVGLAGERAMNGWPRVWREKFAISSPPSVPNLGRPAFLISGDGFGRRRRDRVILRRDAMRPGRHPLSVLESTAADESAGDA